MFKNSNIKNSLEIRNSKLEIDEEYYYDDVRIDQIKSGDEILTLDEGSGEFIYQKVNGLMDMGIQQTYLLLTDTGKTIRTTAQHPYLVREQGLSSGRGLFVESNIGQKNHNHNQGESYNHLNINISKINHVFNPFLNLIAINKHNIPSVALKVNNPNLITMAVLENGTPKATINQPADKLTSKSDNVIVTTGSNFLISSTLSDTKLPVNQREKWIKVSQVRTGMEVATIDGWEKIVAIKEMIREQVWDIEVEGTHNFVGNNIVAHNTYISGIQQSGDGTAAAPAYSFISDTNTGIFRPGADALGLVTGGTKRLTSYHSFPGIIKLNVET